MRWCCDFGSFGGSEGDDVVLFRSGEIGDVGSLCGGEDFYVVSLYGGDVDGVLCIFPHVVIMSESGFSFSRWCEGIDLVRMSAGFSVGGMHLKVIVPDCNSSRAWWTLSDMCFLRLYFPDVVAAELGVEL